HHGFAALILTIIVTAGEPVTLNFQLTAAPTRREGVVATPYGAEQPREVTGSVTSLDPSDFRDVPLPDPAQLLQARAAGVDVVSTEYRPGAPTEVTIRGTRAFTGSNQPLYVVDGVPLVEGGIEDFNSTQIASIEVLKGASATAPYGARGANGVILMTTGGRNGEDSAASGFSYDVQYGAQNALRLVPMMNGPETVRERLDAYRLAGRDTSLGSVFTSDELPQAYCSLNVPTTPAGLYDTTAAGTSTYRATHPGCTTGTDWQRLLLRTGTQQRHRLGYHSTWGDARLSLSGTYFNQGGVTLGQGFHQYAGTVSFEDTFGTLRLGLTAVGARSVADIGADAQLWSEALQNNPLGLPYDSAGTPYPTPCATCTLKTHPTPDPLRTNPLLEQRGYVHQQKTDRLVGSLFGELRLPAGLAYRVTFGPDFQHVADGQFQDTNVVVDGIPIGSSQAGRAVHRAYRWTLDNLVTWSPIAGRHTLDVTALYTMTRSRFEADSTASKDLPAGYQLWYDLGTSTPAFSVSSAARTHAWMGRIAYAYLSRYSVTLTGRQDCSNVDPGRQCGASGSAGVAWQLGDEPFMRSVPFLSGLKLRAGYGSTETASMDAAEASIFLEPGLGWETTKELDVGLDVGLFTNRISGTFDVYRESTNGQVPTRALPLSGFPSTSSNVPETRNAGWELSLGTVNLTGDHGGPRWTTALSFTHNQNYIVSLGDGVGDDVADRWFIGQPISVGDLYSGDALHQVFYDVRMIGIWQLADSALARQYGQKPGDIRVADLNGDGRIDGFDRVITGNTYPRLTASVYNRVAWGGFDLSFLLQGRIGYTFFNWFRVRTVLSDRDNNLNVQYWTPERCDGGPDPAKLDPPAGVTAAQQAAVPGCNVWWSPAAGRQAPTFDDAGNGGPYAAPGYRIGTHWRVRNITLGYALPKSLVRHIRGISSMRVYVEAQDPWVFTSYDGYDPENGGAGGPPSYRTVLVGMNLGF
ncbi:MAG TPA: SusC/RagA family TonB-linked outer membrane protein, partial [Gemmatimonadales bacterium]|nr:SusC/RagA family TonB-linked outer membrane protein [Gemmatimonadales bacterium]